MTNKVQHLRAIGKTTSPATAAGVEGEIALGFPGVAGDATKPTLWAHDGAGWRMVNPEVQAQVVTLGATGADVGAAWAASSATVTGEIVLATWGSPTSTWMLTNHGAPNAAASWLEMGGGLQFATAAQILAGTSTDSIIAPDQLRAHALATPTTTPANDANHLIRLNGAGKIDAGFLTFGALNYQSQVDPTAAGGIPTTWQPGDFGVATTDGNVDAAWAAVISNANTGDSVSAGDLLILGAGGKYSLVASSINLDDYLPLAGGTMNPGAAIVFQPSPGGTAGQWIALDMSGGVIRNAWIDAGTY